MLETLIAISFLAAIFLVMFTGKKRTPQDKDKG